MDRGERLLIEISMQEAVILCIEDTIELDFHGQQIADLGRLSYEAQRGMYGLFVGSMVMKEGTPTKGGY